MFQLNWHKCFCNGWCCHCDSAADLVTASKMWDPLKWTSLYVKIDRSFIRWFVRAYIIFCVVYFIAFPSVNYHRKWLKRERLLNFLWNGRDCDCAISRRILFLATFFLSLLFSELFFYKQKLFLFESCNKRHEYINDIVDVTSIFHRNQRFV